MNQFLRREWEGRDIPEAARVRSRDLAWRQLQSRRRFPGSWLLLPASAGTLLVLWLAWPTGKPPALVNFSNGPLAVLPIEAPARPRIADHLPPTKSLPVQRRQLPVQTAGLDRDPTAVPKPDRLVMNFVLPSSGVRMIWIKENPPSNTGEEE